MAVLVQEIVVGGQSGVAFGQNPNDESQAVIEAVYGLNQGLVDGTVEPDRWILDRETGEIISHTPAHREKAIVPTPEGVRPEPLPKTKVDTPPLDRKRIQKVFDLALGVERLFGAPQDVEWTFSRNLLYVLQSRPITARQTREPTDNRAWYLSLRRSFENLKALRRRIEKELIPAMVEEAESLSRQDVAKLPDAELAVEIARRSHIHERWVKIYWSDFIPFAHGARLFGQVYNDTVRPIDPYEFIDLLGSTNMASLERNRMLEDMAGMIRENPRLAESLRNREKDLDPGFTKVLGDFMERFGDLFQGLAQSTKQREAICRLLLEMASGAPTDEERRSKDVEALKNNFLLHFEGEQKAEVAELLDLGRASYRLRDDDNIYLGRIEGQMLTAIDEGRRRIEKRDTLDAQWIGAEELVKTLEDPSYVPKRYHTAKKAASDDELKARQLVGQPAGPGIAKGKARVILDPSDLFDFKSKEILVCDAVEPQMTFVVPLSAGIVERRGGMLIHGAIIAREYGLPCVTGLPNATSLIHTGDEVTVDGYLGIVVVG